MYLHHLALTIQSKNEVQHFYEKLLGFQLIKEFKLETDLAGKIFNINKPAQVYFLKGHGIALELFIDENQKQNNFDHWCLSFPDREAFMAKAKEQHINIIRIPRDSHDLIFIKDAGNNIFEIKEDPK